MADHSTTTFPTLFVKYTARDVDNRVRPNIQLYTDDQGRSEWDPKKTPLAASSNSVTFFKFQRVAQNLGDEFDFASITFGAEGPNQKAVNNVSRTVRYGEKGKVFFDFNADPSIIVHDVNVYEIAFEVDEIDGVPPKAYIPLDLTVVDTGTGIPTRGHVYTKAGLQIEVR